MLTLTAPQTNLVLQRSGQGAALIPVTGTCDPSATGVDCQLTPIRGGSTVRQQLPVTAGRFDGTLRAVTGWYSLSVTIAGAGGLTVTVPTVGVGEVFLVAGHSIAQGDVRTIAGSADDRVVTVPIDIEGRNLDYSSSGDPALLPTNFVPYRSGISPAPFGANTHYWAKMGELIAGKLNCPVAIFNAAFGATDLEDWAGSATGSQTFQHPFFVHPEKGFPYVNLKNAIRVYAALTGGCRAVLWDHGANDRLEPDVNKIVGYYQTVLSQARTDAGFAALPMMIGRHNPFGTAAQVRQAQERVIAETANCWPGCDFDTIDSVKGRYDGAHLNEIGQAQAAQLWADLITDPAFLARATPWQTRPVPVVSTLAVPGNQTPDSGSSTAWGSIGLNLSFLAGALSLATLILTIHFLARRVRRRPQTA